LFILAALLACVLDESSDTVNLGLQATQRSRPVGTYEIGH
jgi:hypothetical protein